MTGAEKPVSGTVLAKELGVSRQVIVQDIALLRANGYDIVATNRGYLVAPGEEAVGGPRVASRCTTMKARPSTSWRPSSIWAASVEDVMVNHRVYGKVTAPLGLKSRRDIAHFAEDMATGRSSLLMTVTSGYHFHLVSAESEEVLDDIERALADKGYLAEYLPHERE